MPDPRFARLRTDPRFRRPRVKQTKVVVDERFKSIFDQVKNKNGPKVDKYGRAVSASEKGENLRRYYRLEDARLDGEDEKTTTLRRKPDLARGEVMLESSDEEEEKDVFDGENDDSEEDGGFVTLGADPSHREEEDVLEVDLDEDSYADLVMQAEVYSKAFAETEAGDKVEEDIVRTSRLAIVNLDWDYVRAQHLFKICSSLVSPSAPASLVQHPSLSNSQPDYERHKGSSKGGTAHGPIRVVRGQVKNVRVYPSEFGKRRMEREEREGPPREIYKKNSTRDGEVVNERTVYELGDGEEGEYDEDALRKYQLERLRYYYAIVECDTTEAATHIYNELEGTELERSANVFDISFVPEDMTFEGEPRDEVAEDLNAEYKPVEFVTDALRHSKVKLTWDDDDPERNNVTRRALTKREIEEGDFGNYVVGSSSESENDSANKERKGKKDGKDKKGERDKLRALLLAGNGDEIPEGWGVDEDNKDVDMEVTFMPALSKKVGEEDETTLERYQRKVREKRKTRKEGPKGVERENLVEDEFFEVSEGEGEEEEQRRDKSRKKRDKSKNMDEVGKVATADELALLVAPDKAVDEPKHFDIKAVIKAEKDKKRKRKRKGKTGNVMNDEDNEAQEDFVMDVKDERFKALFEDHQFAVDPSNPHFKKTKAMSAILEERQRRRREQIDKSEEVHNRSSSSVTNPKSLQSLVESVKRKYVNADLPGVGKRRKL